MSVVTMEEQGPVSIIRINRPDRLNAISSAVAVELQKAFQAFDRSEQRVAVITAAMYAKAPGLRRENQGGRHA